MERVCKGGTDGRAGGVAKEDRRVLVERRGMIDGGMGGVRGREPQVQWAVRDGGGERGEIRAL